MTDSNIPPQDSADPRSIRDRKPKPGGKVRSLEQGDTTYGFGTKADLYDADLEREMEREMAEALGGADMSQLVGEGPRAKQKPAVPDTGPKKGRVMSIRGKDVFVDTGGRIQGVIALLQFGEEPPKVGDVIEFHIEGYDRDGLLILSRKGAAVEADWSTVAVGMLVEARVKEANKGGLAVEVNGIRGFMPISQIEAFRVEDLAPYVNQKILCLVTEVDREERNLVVSRRALLEKEREEQREQFWGGVAEGQIKEGIVRSIKPFGAFVDVGGADGLLPIGEMSWTRIKDPSEVVQPGQKVRVVILRLDPDTRKLTLGLRQLTTGPWDEVTTNYPIGSVVKGKVTRLMDFGAFVEVGPGLEGLVHVSELSPQRVSRVHQVVKVDDEVNVKILNIDVANRRMGLSIKQAVKAPDPVAEELEEVEEETPARTPRKFTTPLRGGVGQKMIELPMPEEKK